MFIIILGVLVFFHEWGHFIAAKLSGIRVEEFAFGFGPKLARIMKRGDTEYTIHAVPLGGFVKLTGMEPGEEEIEDGFQAQAIWKRAAVIFAGPLFSFILGAVVLLFVGLYWGFPDDTVTARVGMVQPQTEAAKIDLRAGDRIREINGARITNGAQVLDIIHSSPGKKMDMVIDRDGRTLTKTAEARWVIHYLGVSWSFMGNGATVMSVDEPSAAAKAGIQPDDKLVSINGTPVPDGPALLAVIKSAEGKPARLEVSRGGNTLTATIQPGVEWVRFAGAKWIFPGAYAKFDPGVKPSSEIKEYDRIETIDGRKIASGEDMLQAVRSADGHPLNVVVKRGEKDRSVSLRLAAGPAATGDYTAIGLLGFVPAPHMVKRGLGESLELGFSRISLYMQALLDVLTHSSKIKKEIGGPVMIFRATQQSVALGPSAVFWLLGSLSLGLAVVNLIPLPAVLDGGHLFLLAVEAVRRKRWSRAQMQAMQMFGLAVVFVLVILIFASDITKIVTGQAPQ